MCQRVGESMKVGSFLGIVFKVNPFFLLLITLAFVFGQLLPALILFAIVLFHELAHTITAFAYGLRVIEVELLPFGAVARMDHLLELNPKIETVVALAGPLSNLLLLAVLWACHTYGLLVADWFWFLARANLSMAALNLLPGLPLDGGRILRSRLLYRCGFCKATERAAKMGQFLAVGLMALGLIGSLAAADASGALLVVVGIFLFMAAKKEAAQAMYVFLRYLIQKQFQVRTERVMPAKELVATCETTVGEVIRCLTPSFYHLIWIIDLQGRLIGVLTELELINGLLEQGIHDKLNKLVKQRFNHRYD